LLSKRENRGWPVNRLLGSSTGWQSRPNRWGSAVYSAAQLKTMQEVITLIVFAGFSVLYLKEPLGWNHGLGFAPIAAGAFFIFHKWS
jgi:uncharacterized protein (DUF486 family)